MRLPSTGQNTGVQKPIGSTAASVNIPVHRRNTAGPYISLPTTIQDRIFQGIVPAMSNVYVHFSQISFPARYSVVNFQLGSHSLRFREVIIFLLSYHSTIGITSQSKKEQISFSAVLASARAFLFLRFFFYLPRHKKPGHTFPIFCCKFSDG